MSLASVLVKQNRRHFETFHPQCLSCFEVWRELNTKVLPVVSGCLTVTWRLLSYQPPSAMFPRLRTSPWPSSTPCYPRQTWYTSAYCCRLKLVQSVRQVGPNPLLYTVFINNVTQTAYHMYDFWLCTKKYIWKRRKLVKTREIVSFLSLQVENRVVPVCSFWNFSVTWD